MTDTTQETSTVGPLQIRRILDLLPHRYPFLLIDRVLGYVPRTSLTALKNVTMNEPFFQGHFPENPVMPGVLVLEALAQAGALLISLNLEENDNSLFIFTGIDKARFRRPVVPGDQLILNCWDIRHRRNFFKMTCDARVGDQVVAQAGLAAALVSPDEI
ncbi:3-hydroxyacyl-ACP dehydratase FabZ [Oceanidesulfovibrio marinus]|uniref:3-hydroxyacyl-[acyl-carrier-protein] dehydratase FabZ n=1 Tax=Oceanidesulfovibrio marinus TaxID=370038 RepID=A0A6P1ZAL8_9BACT|nr:3-hydroxyacyl-ACP dehydratase FabZ [Oceanidesulfovibrio marinus]QJT10447.1 3-hydroxyacyl-ACP dehydratase FabZ [Oceanidesulfovibrio marinus]TVM30692.1 3-hydroxyacyl-[acyl-carrier-protein] dehydratase FabZ [Oceanidesulfovibrio marinus]